MKKLILFFAIIMFQNLTFAQTSIGFKNPENIQPLLNYRLPSWGYSYLNIDFSSNGGGDKKDIDVFQFALGPNFYKYYESENNTWQIGLITYYRYHFNLDYSYYDEDSNELEQSQTKANNIHYRLSGYWHRYINSLMFIGIKNITGGNYQKTKNAISSTDKNFHTDSYISIGIGRVRNVTPIIKALRMNERLQRLELVDELSPEQIHKIAHTIAKYGGYVRVRDRHKKNFGRIYLDLYLQPKEI